MALLGKIKEANNPGGTRPEGRAGVERLGYVLVRENGCRQGGGVVTQVDEGRAERLRREDAQEDRAASEGRALGEAGGIPQEVLEALAGHGTDQVERRATAEADGGGRGKAAVKR